MTDFLSSLKADLLDRRLLPILAVLSLALVAAVAYAVLGGGSTATPAPTGATTTVAPLGVGVAVKPAPTSTSQPVAETTSGSSLQRGGATRNPFAPLPGAAKTASASSSSSSSGSSSSGSASSGSASSGSSSSPASSGQSKSESPKSSGGTPPSQSKPAPAKPKTVYQVAVLFGAVPAGTPLLSAQLTPYQNLKRQQPLPDAKQPLIVFRGVIAGGKSATFTLVGEAILRGSAACLPSASQCQAIDLKPGQTEELEYIPPGGTAIVYQLQVASIKSSKASASAASRAFHVQSKSGLELLRHVGLTALPGLRYSGKSGVLVFARHRAFSARAHVAAWGARAFG
jgi:hypothetical protein